MRETIKIIYRNTKSRLRCEEDEIQKLMMDREIWKSLARSGRARARLKYVSNTILFIILFCHRKCIKNITYHD